MEEEPIMCKRNLRLLVYLCTLVTFTFAQSEVVLTMQTNGDLDYDSSEGIAGFQFSHGGCVSSVSGGDAAAAGFTVSSSSSAVIGFS